MKNLAKVFLFVITTVMALFSDMQVNAEESCVTDNTVINETSEILTREVFVGWFEIPSGDIQGCSALFIDSEEDDTTVVAEEVTLVAPEIDGVPCPTEEAASLPTVSEEIFTVDGGSLVAPVIDGTTCPVEEEVFVGWFEIPGECIDGCSALIVEPSVEPTSVEPTDVATEEVVAVAVDDTDSNVILRANAFVGKEEENEEQTDVASVEDAVAVATQSGSNDTSVSGGTMEGSREGTIVVLDSGVEATTNGTERIVAVEGEVIPSITVPTSENYVFGGYADENHKLYINAGGEGVAEYDGSSTLHAIWMEKLDKTLITLDSGNADSHGTNEVIATYGKSVQIAEVPVKEGYVFKGYFDAEGNMVIDENGNGVIWDSKDRQVTISAVFEAEKPAPASALITEVNSVDEVMVAEEETVAAADLYARAETTSDFAGILYIMFASAVFPILLAIIVVVLIIKTIKKKVSRESDDSNSKGLNSGNDLQGSKSPNSCSASVGMDESPLTEEGRYLVFVRNFYLRDTQALLSAEIDEDIHSEKNDDLWQDVEGDVLLYDGWFYTEDAMWNRMLEIYPDCPENHLRFICIPTGKDVISK